MRGPIALSEIEETVEPIGRSGGSSAPVLEGATVALRGRFLSTDSDSLEALRYARRAMLREEWTRGVEAGEPSLEDAVFSAFEVVWSVPAGEQQASREKLFELVERANRAVAELAERSPS
jgi:hypothetical protein